ncbi:MAG TPA: right-handed parallel beta-helix repeat-containing protein [Acidobacteriaceae bacterium]|nr:right-handed parallel beta-helix repeat-containing protein [Acidobacteriaceae bacterium]
MSGTSNTFLNRRDVARGAVFGGAALLFAGAARADAVPERGLLQGRELGAVGDGKTDDTLALQKALDLAAETSSAVFLAPGVYLTGELHVRPGIALVGVPAWNYGGPGGTVLRLAKGESKCLLNLTEARGATIEGLALDGGGLGQNVHGVFTDRTKWGEHEDGFRIEGCQIARFTGDGARLMCVWCFSVRHSMLAYNHGDGLNLRGWDGFLLDNWFSGNGRAGFAARRENASVTFTANRIEWNHEENMLVTGGDGYQITGNFFDRAGTCGLALRKSRVPCTQMTVTGNFFKRSGKLADGASEESAQIVLDGARGVTCVGNNLQAGRDDGNKGVYGPAYGIVYTGLQDCVISNNVLYDGALRKLLFDQGGHGDGVVVKDNPGRLMAAKG